MHLSRRHFLKMSTAVSLGFGGMHSLFQRTALATPGPEAISSGFGPLRRDPHRVLDLPDGFSYRVISRSGDMMDDGLRTPARPDGMAAFPGPRGRTILVRNHEISASAVELGAFGEDYAALGTVDPAHFYDFGNGKQPCLGGTTTLVVDTHTGTVERQYVSLFGTERNCAGGPTPWGSWITCEETIQRAEAPYEQDHGYNFEVPVSATGEVARPVALRAMGRFNHEAIAVDPRSGAVYQTEDRPDGLIYRYLPHQPGNLAAGGTLQVLCITGTPSCDTRNWAGQPVFPAGVAVPVHWLDMDGVESPGDDLRMRGFAGGAARFARGEGMWYGRGAIFIACTNGGQAEKGQIFKYTPSRAEGTSEEGSSPGLLTLFVEPNDGGIVDNCDNLTVAPWGDLVVCEDGGGDEHVIGITPEGEVYKIARTSSYDAPEFAGSTFSPDGTTLFVNSQDAGLTLAITGPWHQRA